MDEHNYPKNAAEAEHEILTFALKEALAKHAELLNTLNIILESEKRLIRRNLELERQLSEIRSILED
jgi:hypothetical protein